MIYLRQLDMKVTMMISLIVMRSNTKSQVTSKERNIEHRTLGLSMCIRLCLCSSSVCFQTCFSSKRGFQFPVPWASLKYIICPNSNRIVLETFIIPVDPLYHSNKKKTCNTSVKVSKTFVTFPNLGSKPAICSTEILRKDMDFFPVFSCITGYVWVESSATPGSGKIRALKKTPSIAISDGKERIDVTCFEKKTSDQAKLYLLQDVCCNKKLDLQTSNFQLYLKPWLQAWGVSSMPKIWLLIQKSAKYWDSEETRC